MSTQLQQVSFHDQQITVLTQDSKPYVAMKPICENIGLDWSSQVKRIKRNSVLARGMVIMTTPSKSGIQEYVCLSLSMLNGWLLGIDINRVKPEIRDSLERYQLEAFDVLYRHFMPKVALQYPNTITVEQQQAIKRAINDRHYSTGETHQAIYSKLYAQFKIPRYQELPASKFKEAILFLTNNGVLNDEITVNRTNLICLVANMLWLAKYFNEKKIYEAFGLLGTNYGVRMNDHFGDGAFVAGAFKRQIENELNDTSIFTPYLCIR